MSLPWLTLMILLPLAGGLVLLLKRQEGRFARAIALAVNGIVLAFTIALASAVRGGGSLVEKVQWLPAIGLEYHLAVDGISAVFLLLTGLVFLMSTYISRQEGAIDSRYFALLLLLQGGLLGTFAARNFLHFFFFWEISLIPAFFLVKLYGGANRSAAALQFFVYTMVGSIAMLVGFLAIYLASGTFDLDQLSRFSSGGLASALEGEFTWSGLSARGMGLLIFTLVFLGVAVKVPLWPLHGWLPATYTEAPTPVTMALTGVMSKMGVYGLIRLVLPIFPEQIQQLHKPLLALAVVTILYGAFAAFGQRDIKRLFSYSSLSHLGYCFLAVFAAAKAGLPGLEADRAAAINGVVLQVLSHGMIAAAIFGFVAFLERRTGGLRTFESFGGLRQIHPRFAGFMGVAVFSSLGLPGLSGFPAEFLIFKGTFALAPAAAAFAVLGLLMTAVYLLTFYGRVFLGPLNSRRTDSLDLSNTELAAVAPALALSLVLGFVPHLVLAITNPAVTRLVEGLGL